MKPIIGILAEVDEEFNTSVKSSYVKAIELSGGAPILLPYVTEPETVDRFIDICDGILFAGGADISPERYGESKSEFCGDIHHNRDKHDFAAIEKALATTKPILALCRGLQLVNVALGGKLYQDIPSEYKTNIQHRQADPNSAIAHEVEVLPGTPLSALTGIGWIPINSHHHQAIKKLGDGLKVMAIADDGIIEAVYLEERYLRAYQWHPEKLYDHDENNRCIFDDFIEACRTISNLRP